MPVMEKFTFSVSAECTLRHDVSEHRSEVEEVTIGLVLSENLEEASYVRSDGNATASGSKMLAQGFIMGLVANFQNAVDLGYHEPAALKAWVLAEVDRQLVMSSKLVTTRSAFKLQLNTFTPTAAGQSHTHVIAGRASTNIELVEELQVLNQDGRYDELILKASKGLYHDWKNPGDHTGPKALLAEDLVAFPELHPIRAKVLDGYYDEQMDESDIAEMQAWISEHFFKTAGQS
jgi:hypothetical protein